MLKLRQPSLRQRIWQLEDGLGLFWGWFTAALLSVLGFTAVAVARLWINEIAAAHRFIWPDFSRVALVQAFFFVIPWPLTVFGLVVLCALTAVSYLAHSSRVYRDLQRRAGNVYDEALRMFNKVIYMDLYTERRAAAEIFTHFIHQDGQKEKMVKPICVVVGPGGAGKSAFLLRQLGEISGRFQGEQIFPCIFLRCDQNTISSVNALRSAIEDSLGHRMDEIIQALGKGANRRLVIFIDAWNENITSVDTNSVLDEFSSEYLEHAPIYLCLSIRQNAWERPRPTDSQSGGVWRSLVYEPEAKAETTVSTNPPHSTYGASILLERFEWDEFDKAYQGYAHKYSISGTMEDPRTKEVCRNPLLLIMFCEAFRGKDIGGHAILREVDVFTAYAERAYNDTIATLSLPLEVEDNAERITRGWLFEIALGMVQSRTTFLSYSEVMKIAREAILPTLPPDVAIQVGKGDFLDKVLRGIIARDLVLASSVHETPNGERVSGVQFVYERYFEFSIGRAKVNRLLIREGKSREEIIKQFNADREEHWKLLQVGFPNLLPGLGMMIPVIEDEPQAPKGIAYDLLDQLVADTSSHQFAWKQLACQMMQELRVFNRQQQTERSAQERLLRMLDTIAGQNDFVLRWDLERALLRASEVIDAHLVLGVLEEWCRAPIFSQQLFGAECLGYLFGERPELRRDVLLVVQRVVAAASASPSDFWIRRGLMFSLDSMTRALQAHPDSEIDIDVVQRQLPMELLMSAQRWWDRSVVLATQVEQFALRSRQQASTPLWDWTQEANWTKVNAALALGTAAVSGRATTEHITMLRRIWDAHLSPVQQTPNPHLAWAIQQTLQLAITHSRTRPLVRDPVREAARALHDDIVAAFRQSADERATWLKSQPIGQTEGETAFPVTVVYHPVFARADLHNHPEAKERVEAIVDYLESFAAPHQQMGKDIFHYANPYHFTQPSDEMLLRLVHPEQWIKRVEELSHRLDEISRLGESAAAHQVLEGDTEVRAGSYEDACLAVRGAALAANLVVNGSQARNQAPRLAVGLLRPPGHLAGNKICIFNNIAIAARYTQEALAPSFGLPAGQKPRVLIVDADAHHGKSSQDIFWGNDPDYPSDNESAVYFSTHQAGVHPGTGQFKELGAHPTDAPHIFNVPIPKNSGDRVYAEVLDQVLQPLLDHYQPDMIFVSLGLDAYYRDDFSQLELSEWSFYALSRRLYDYCQRYGKKGVVATLEGGYCLDAMGSCVLQFMRVFSPFNHSLGDFPEPHLGSALLDHYLRQRDEDGAATTAKEGVLESLDEVKKWLDEVGTLRGLIERRWAL